MVAKAEQLEGQENPRYVVTNLSAEQWPAQALYEDLYCERGEMENRVKEQLTLFAARVSAATLRANQLRLYFSAAAYLLVHGVRRLGLKGTQLARAQVATIRLRLRKIGAQIRVTARTVWVSLASSYPLREVFARAWVQLRCGGQLQARPEPALATKTQARLPSGWCLQRPLKTRGEAPAGVPPTPD